MSRTVTGPIMCAMQLLRNPQAIAGDFASVGPVELAERAADGLEFSLWWDQPTGRLWVDVRTRSGESWSLDAPPQRALDVFYHPFAYCDAGEVLAATAA
jgi:hypothetical protein